MPAAVSVEVNLSQLGDFLPKFVRATQKSVAEVVKQQAKLMLRDENDNGLIKFTPPQGMTEAKQKGDALVRRDIHRVFLTKASALQIAGKAGVRGLRVALNRALKERNDAKVLELLNKKQSGTVRVKGYTRNGKRVADYTQKRDVSGLNNNRLGYLTSVAEAPERSVHKSRQDARNQVRRNRWSQLVLSKGALSAYIEQIQKRVGTLKAGWRPAARALGLSLPPFINGVERVSGSVEIKLEGNNPSVTMVNAVPKADRLTRKAIDFVRQGRLQAMRTNLEKVLQAQAKELA